MIVFNSYSRILLSNNLDEYHISQIFFEQKKKKPDAKGYYTMPFILSVKTNKTNIS